MNRIFILFACVFAVIINSESTAQTTPPPVCNITPGYTWKVDSLNHFEVYFTNTSIASTTKLSARWFFGDNGSDSTWSPMHTFAIAGRYYVCLRVQSDSNCYQYKCDSITISASQTPPLCDVTPGYTWKVDSLDHYKVYFTNISIASTAKLSARWFYGDGGFDTAWNPTHTFANSGSYYVCLRVQADSNCYQYKCDSIAIAAAPAHTCNIKPGYTWKLDSLNHYKVYFTNTSIDSTSNLSARWFYGDGGSDSTWNTTHTFANAGKYYVCLRVQADSNCYQYKCDSITIIAHSTPPLCNITPGYTWKIDSLNHYKVYFTNNSIASATSLSARWFYGDGGFDSTWNPTHIFASAGTYYVCLRVQADSTCYQYKCDSITIAAAPSRACNITPGFTWMLDSLNHYTVYFTNTTIASATRLSARWFYGDGGFDSTWSPTHTFANAGKYYVCLRVQADSNCYQYKCDSITIGDAPPPTCNITPGYTWKFDSLNHYKVYFTNTSVASTAKLSARWFYGDGGFDSTWNPSHTFAKAGTYYVCLRVQADSECYQYKCDSITITKPLTSTSRCELYAYPNPAHWQVTVDIQLNSSEIINAYLYNSQSINLITFRQQGHAGYNTVIINTHRLAAGYYIVKIFYDNHSCFAKFLKN